MFIIVTFRDFISLITYQCAQLGEFLAIVDVEKALYGWLIGVDRDQSVKNHDLGG